MIMTTLRKTFISIWNNYYIANIYKDHHNIVTLQKYNLVTTRKKKIFLFVK